MSKKLHEIHSLYMHFPFCRHLCNYCDFYKKIGPSQDQFESFHKYLSNSVEVHQDLLEKNSFKMSELKTLYFGGGTPSLWDETGARYLRNFFKSQGLSLGQEAEVTLEVNPGSWTDAGLDAFKEFGVNRFSLGIQSLDEKFLKVLDRVHSLDDVYQTLDKFKRMDSNFSVDFMLGLPFSKSHDRNIERELNEILAFNPNHISLYILTTYSDYIHKDHIPDEEWIEAEYLKVAEILKAHGFVHYEVSNFSRPGLESQHNLSYWRSNSVAALGPSATGLLSDAGVRYKWVPGKEPKLNLETLDTEALRLESFYMKLRTNLGVKGLDYFEGNDLDLFEKLTENWEQRGFIESRGGNHVVLGSKGFLVLDGLMNELFSKVKSL